MARPSTKLGPGFVVSASISVRGIDEPELCGQFTLNPQGAIELSVGYKPIEPIRLNGMTCDQAGALIANALRKYFSDKPYVRVQIAKMPRIQVVVQGAFYQNGVASLPLGARLIDLFASIQYAPGADLSRVQITRIAGSSRATMIADFNRALLQSGADDPINDPPLQQGDVIRLDMAAIPEPPAEISVLGEVRRQGRFPYQRGMKVRDALQLCLGLAPAADPERITIAHRDGSFARINGTRALDGIATDDLALSPEDTIVVATKDSGKRYLVMGAVAQQRSFEWKAPVPLSQAISDAGGFRPEADQRAVTIVRSLWQDPQQSQTVVINFEKVRRGESPDVTVDAGDMVEVPQKKKMPNQLLNIGFTLLRLFLF